MMITIWYCLKRVSFADGFVFVPMSCKETIISIVVLILLGAGMHFDSFPVIESVMAHMKMVFYPMLLLSIYLCVSRRGSPGPEMAWQRFRSSHVAPMDPGCHYWRHTDRLPHLPLPRLARIRQYWITLIDIYYLVL